MGLVVEAVWVRSAHTPPRNVAVKLLKAAALTGAALLLNPG
jgi:hypothetical protein